MVIKYTNYHGTTIAIGISPEVREELDNIVDNYDKLIYLAFRMATQTKRAPGWREWNFCCPHYASKTYYVRKLDGDKLYYVDGPNFILNNIIKRTGKSFKQVLDK